MHVRQQIRDSIFARLNGLTAAGINIFTSRGEPMARNISPAIVIYTKSEEVTETTQGTPVNHLRELEVVIELYLKSSGAIDAELDDLAAEVEVLLGAKCKLEPFYISLEYDSFETSYTYEGNKVTLLGEMVYTVIYSVNADDPNTGV